jgi:hypothetical protein
MKKLAKMLGALLLAGVLVAPAAQAGDVLFYYGHAGINEGHTEFISLISGEGGTVDQNNDATLPTLVGSDYTLALISVPGWGDPNAYFSATEKQDIIDWLVNEAHKLVLIGEWDGFYGQGQQVLIDLVNAVGGGTGIDFIPGVYDSGCFAYECGGTLTSDPLVDGLDHVCKAATAIWDPGNGAAVAFPYESTIDPWVVSNGTVETCIVGIGDSNTLSDGCSHINGDADTAEFARRLYTITCGGNPVPTESTTWGALKANYR